MKAEEKITEDAGQLLTDYLEQEASALTALAKDLWEHPEVSGQEVRSCGVLKAYLEKKGFLIKEVKGCPSSFVAQWGNGHPIIGILGEYDALPGMSQQVSDSKAPRGAAGDPGHACGHNLLGTAGAGAVAAIQAFLKTRACKGTIRFYGCPAEETLSGKPRMARTGVFDDLDAALTWHPSFVNTVWGATFLANNSVKFHFKGIPSHAAAAPEAGRSALDAVELMDIGANYLREHVSPDVRIHYVITNGGQIPNVVPEDAEVWYQVRCASRTGLRSVMGRLVRIAKGAAMMTDTRMDWHLEAGCYEVLPNRVLGDVLLENMKKLGGPAFDEADRTFAGKLYEQVDAAAREAVVANFRAPEGCLAQILSDTVFENRDDGYAMPGSTDVGDVSQIVPLATMTAACWPVGVSSHTWMSCACTGSGIGFHAMLFAAGTLAMSGVELLTRPELLERAQQEFREKTKGAVYCSAFDEDYEHEN